jgi:hypothetical protein
MLLVTGLAVPVGAQPLGGAYAQPPTPDDDVGTPPPDVDTSPPSPEPEPAPPSVTPSDQSPSFERPTTPSTAPPLGAPPPGAPPIEPPAVPSGTEPPPLVPPVMPAPVSRAEDAPLPFSDQSAPSTSSGSVAPRRATGPAARRSAALGALDRMATFLRSLQDVEVEGETTTDDILASGQKVQYGGTVKLKIRRPDRMAAEVVSDRKNEQMFYDGTTFTVFQPKVGYYASFAAPPDLRGLVNVLEQRYGIDLPLADLFRWGTDTGQIEAIQRATYLGRSNVKGAPCEHFAFHQADVDWEVWIQEGDQPLPRKLVITTLTEKTQPQYMAIMTWNLRPKPDPLAFTFNPPPNARRISFETASITRPASRQGRAPAPRRGPTP